MINPFEKKYKLIPSITHQPHFSFTVLIAGLIAQGRLTQQMKFDLIERADNYAIMSLWKKIETDDEPVGPEDIKGKEYWFTEKEILNYLFLSHYISELLNGPQFMLLKRFIPDMDPDKLKDKDKHLATFEGFSGEYVKWTNLLIRQALIKFRHRPVFCQRLKDRIY